METEYLDFDETITLEYDDTIGLVIAYRRDSDNPSFTETIVVTGPRED